jgi:hypothetical protein
MRAAQELLGAPTIGKGSARPEGGGGGSQRSQISLPSRLECTKTAPKCHFYFTVLNKIYSQEVF